MSALCVELDICLNREILMICPNCQGRKTVFGIQHFNSGVADIGEHTCTVCKGTGNVLPEHLRRLEEGERIRRDRLSKGLSISEAAEQLGISISDLSDLEHGRVSKEELGLDTDA
jgi:hypothetical protein